MLRSLNIDQLILVIECVILIQWLQSMAKVGIDVLVVPQKMVGCWWAGAGVGMGMVLVVGFPQLNMKMKCNSLNSFNCNLPIFQFMFVDRCSSHVLQFLIHVF